MNNLNQPFVRKPSTPPKIKDQDNSAPKKTQKFTRKPQTTLVLPPYIKSSNSNINQPLSRIDSNCQHSEPHSPRPTNSYHALQQKIQPTPTKSSKYHENQNKRTPQKKPVDQPSEQKGFTIFNHLKSVEEEKTEHVHSSYSSENPSDQQSLIEPEEFLTSFNQKFFNPSSEKIESPKKSHLITWTKQTQSEKEEEAMRLYENQNKQKATTNPSSSDSIKIPNPYEQIIAQVLQTNSSKENLAQSSVSKYTSVFRSQNEGKENEERIVMKRGELWRINEEDSLWESSSSYVSFKEQQSGIQCKDHNQNGDPNGVYHRLLQGYEQEIKPYRGDNKEETVQQNKMSCSIERDILAGLKTNQRYKSKQFESVSGGQIESGETTPTKQDYSRFHVKYQIMRSPYKQTQFDCQKHPMNNNHFYQQPKPFENQSLQLQRSQGSLDQYYQQTCRQSQGTQIQEKQMQLRLQNQENQQQNEQSQEDSKEQSQQQISAEQSTSQREYDDEVFTSKSGYMMTESDRSDAHQHQQQPGPRNSNKDKKSQSHIKICENDSSSLIQHSSIIDRIEAHRPGSFMRCFGYDYYQDQPQPVTNQNIQPNSFIVKSPNFYHESDQTGQNSFSQANKSLQDNAFIRCKDTDFYQYHMDRLDHVIVEVLQIKKHFQVHYLNSIKAKTTQSEATNRLILQKLSFIQKHFQNIPHPNQENIPNSKNSSSRMEGNKNQLSHKHQRHSSLSVSQPSSKPNNAKYESKREQYSREAEQRIKIDERMYKAHALSTKNINVPPNANHLSNAESYSSKLIEQVESTFNKNRLYRKTQNPQSSSESHNNLQQLLQINSKYDGGHNFAGPCMQADNYQWSQDPQEVRLKNTHLNGFEPTINNDSSPTHNKTIHNPGPNAQMLQSIPFIPKVITTKQQLDKALASLQSSSHQDSAIVCSINPSVPKIQSSHPQQNCLPQNQKIFSNLQLVQKAHLFHQHDQHNIKNSFWNSNSSKSNSKSSIPNPMATIQNYNPTQYKELLLSSTQQKSTHSQHINESPQQTSRQKSASKFLAQDIFTETQAKLCSKQGSEGLMVSRRSQHNNLYQSRVKVDSECASLRLNTLKQPSDVLIQNKSQYSVQIQRSSLNQISQFSQINQTNQSTEQHSINHKISRVSKDFDQKSSEFQNQNDKKSEENSFIGYQYSAELNNSSAKYSLTPSINPNHINAQTVPTQFYEIKPEKDHSLESRRQLQQTEKSLIDVLIKSERQTISITQSQMYQEKPNEQIKITAILPLTQNLTHKQKTVVPNLLQSTNGCQRSDQTENISSDNKILTSKEYIKSPYLKLIDNYLENINTRISIANRELTQFNQQFDPISPKYRSHQNNNFSAQSQIKKHQKATDFKSSSRNSFKELKDRIIDHNLERISQNQTSPVSENNKYQKIQVACSDQTFSKPLNSYSKDLENHQNNLDQPPSNDNTSKALNQLNNTPACSQTKKISLKSLSSTAKFQQKPNKLENTSKKQQLKANPVKSDSTQNLKSEEQKSRKQELARNGIKEHEIKVISFNKKLKQGQYCKGETKRIPTTVCAQSCSNQNDTNSLSNNSNNSQTKTCTENSAQQRRYLLGGRANDRDTKDVMFSCVGSSQNNSSAQLKISSQQKSNSKGLDCYIRGQNDSGQKVDYEQQKHSEKVTNSNNCEQQCTSVGQEKDSIEMIASDSSILTSIYYNRSNKELFKYKWYKFK